MLEPVKLAWSGNPEDATGRRLTGPDGTVYGLVEASLVTGEYRAFVVHRNRCHPVGFDFQNVEPAERSVLMRWGVNA